MGCSSPMTALEVSEQSEMRGVVTLRQKSGSSHCSFLVIFLIAWPKQLAR